MAQTELEWEWVELAGQTGMLRRFKLPGNSAAPPQTAPKMPTEVLIKSLSTLLPEQEIQISSYREKWRDLVLQTAPLDRGQVRRSIAVAYNLLSLYPPDIQFFPSPHAALPAIAHQLEHVITQKWVHDRSLSRFALGDQLVGQLSWWLDGQLQTQVWKRFQVERSQHIWAPVWQPLEQELWQRLEPLLPEKESDFYSASRFHEAKQQELKQWICSYCQPPETWTETLSFLDFCISVLQCNPNPGFWQAFQQLIQASTWLFPFRDTCIVCERPTTIHINDRYQLHAIGKSAVRFADGRAIKILNGRCV